MVLFSSFAVASCRRARGLAVFVSQRTAVLALAPPVAAHTKRLSSSRVGRPTQLNGDSQPSASTGIPDLRLLELRAMLDRQIIGHEDAKEALLLGLLAREHVYIEGPPGIGKTQLAEVAAEAAGLSRFFYQFHRDTRVNELIGDATIVREQTPDGEIIRQGLRPGGLLEANVCVLDDISRAPGEALNVLLRMLNERKYAGTALPLRCAIATGNPTREEFFNEPLDPAVLDRFTLQVSAGGLVKGADWEAAARVVRQYCAPASEGSAGNSGINGFSATQWGLYDEGLSAVELPEELMQALLKVLAALVAEHGLGTGHPSLLTDRTFLVKAPRVMRARALLEGRTCCTEEDLYVLRLLTRFRIPEAIHDRISEIIDKVLEEQREEPPPPDKVGQGGGGKGASKGEPPQSQQQQHQPSQEKANDEERTKTKESTFASHLLSALKYMKFFLDSLRGVTPKLNTDPVNIEGAEMLLKSLSGCLQRSTADMWSHAGGVPRQWRPMRCLSEAEDADMVALSLWCSTPSPLLPRTAQRQRTQRGGAMAIIRDISDSMSRPRQEYLLARCASTTVRAIVELARSSHMRVGYTEFGDQSFKHFTRDSGKEFFTRDYLGIQELASNLATRGSTHYQQAIREVLTEFEKVAKLAGSERRWHAVMLSDGEPTAGCRDLTEERAWAQRLKVRFHTIFIGTGRYPAVLAQLAMDTGGRRFQAVPFYESGQVRVVDVSNEPIADMPRWNKWIYGMSL